VRDVSENLSDLAKHVPNGNSALARQDIAVIRRNVQQIVRVTSGHTQRFYQGLDEGLSNCSD
jgi:2-keto-3-deoxy-L-rhamnonate aldolase RhmA